MWVLFSSRLQTCLSTIANRKGGEVKALVILSFAESSPLSPPLKGVNRTKKTKEICFSFPKGRLGMCLSFVLNFRPIFFTVNLARKKNVSLFMFEACSVSTWNGASIWIGCCPLPLSPPSLLLSDDGVLGGRGGKTVIEWEGRQRGRLQ